MGSSQDFDDLSTTSSPPVRENKPTPTKSQLDLNTTDQKGSQSGLQVQRIPFTKSPVGSSQAAKRIVKTGGEAAVAAVAASGSSRYNHYRNSMWLTFSPLYAYHDRKNVLLINMVSLCF